MHNYIHNHFIVGHFLYNFPFQWFLLKSITGKKKNILLKKGSKNLFVVVGDLLYAVFLLFSGLCQNRIRIGGTPDEL